MNRKLKILIADDHPLLRKGLAELINKYSDGFEVISEAENGEEALKKTAIQNPDIIILDIEMPVKDGFQVIRELKEKKNKTEIIILTAHKEEHYFNKAMDLGVIAFVDKESALDEICDCLEMTSKGSYYISPQFSSYLVKRLKKRDEFRSAKPSVKDLTPTERKVLKFISESKTSKEIADILFISDQTVNKHRSNISEKLDLHGTHSLIKFAIENKDLL